MIYNEKMYISWRMCKICEEGAIKNLRAYVKCLDCMFSVQCGVFDVHLKWNLYGKWLTGASNNKWGVSSVLNGSKLF